MIKRLFFYIFIGTFFIVLAGLFTLRNINNRRIIDVDNTRTVYIKKTDNKFQLIKNGKPFYIRGVSGNPVYFKELALMGANTIRTYDTINLENILNEAEKYNLHVIVGIDLPAYTKSSHSPYFDKEYRGRLKQQIRNLVQKYHNHNALLMWNLGNELNYPLVLRKNLFIETFNDLIEIIHTEDKNHLVGTVIASKKKAFGIHFHSPELDIMGFNAFGGLKRLSLQSSIIFFFTKSIPYYVSEWGINGPWEAEETRWGAPIEQTSTKKGEILIDRYRAFIEDNKESLGSLFFYWGQKQETTHTWFSIFDEKGRKSQAYYDLQTIWKGTTDTAVSPPQIRYMLLDNKGARDNLIFRPNEQKSAQLLLDSKIDSTIQYHWEIYKEAWNDPMGKRPKIVCTGIENVSDSFVEFQVPEIEGPYRIFAYVYDKNGNFATTNTPFYVLNPNEPARNK